MFWFSRYFCIFSSGLKTTSIGTFLQQCQTLGTWITVGSILPEETDTFTFSKKLFLLQNVFRCFSLTKSYFLSEKFWFRRTLKKISHAAFKVFLEIGVGTALGWCFAKAPQSMSSVVSSVHIIQVYFQDKENGFSSLPFELTKVCDFQDWSAKSLR